MKTFWQGFENVKTGRARKPARKHSILAYFDSAKDDVTALIKLHMQKNPHIQVKLIDMAKRTGPQPLAAHGITSFPTLLLLKDGREVDRCERTLTRTVLEQFFSRAQAA